MTPRLVDPTLPDAFRDGLDEERFILVLAHHRKIVLDRMRRWETDMHALTLRIERLRGRMHADNQWLTDHPEGDV